jgi:hypothetical protein
MSCNYFNKIIFILFKTVTMPVCRCRLCGDRWTRWRLRQRFPNYFISVCHAADQPSTESDVNRVSFVRGFKLEEAANENYWCFQLNINSFCYSVNINMNPSVLITLIGISAVEFTFQECWIGLEQFWMQPNAYKIVRSYFLTLYFSSTKSADKR